MVQKPLLYGPRLELREDYILGDDDSYIGAYFPRGASATSYFAVRLQSLFDQIHAMHKTLPKKEKKKKPLQIEMERLSASADELKQKLNTATSIIRGIFDGTRTVHDDNGNLEEGLRSEMAGLLGEEEGEEEQEEEDEEEQEEQEESNGENEEEEEGGGGGVGRSVKRARLGA